MKENKNLDKKNNKIIFLVIGVVILCILGFFVYINLFANTNVKSVNVENNQIDDFIISDLKFETQIINNQVNIVMTNISEEDLNIKSVVVKITDKEKNIDKIELDYNQILLSGNKTNMSLAYEIKNIDKMSFEVIFNE